MNRVSREKHLCPSWPQENVFPKPNLSPCGTSLLSTEAESPVPGEQWDLSATTEEPATHEMPSIPSVLGLSQRRKQVRAVAVSSWTPCGNTSPPNGGLPKKVPYDQGGWEAVRGLSEQHLLWPPAGVGGLWDL